MSDQHTNETRELDRGRDEDLRNAATYLAMGIFHMVPTARRGKIRGQFTWNA